MAHHHNPETIWLEPFTDEACDRTWCEDDLSDDETKWVEYTRADCVNKGFAKLARIAELEAQVKRLKEGFGDVIKFVEREKVQMLAMGGFSFETQLIRKLRASALCAEEK